MTSCLILYNILVTNRIMNSCKLMNDPAYSVAMGEMEIEDHTFDKDMEESLDYLQIRLSNKCIMKVLTRDKHWLRFNDREEYKRLVKVAFQGVDG